ncbi:2-phospho-L-lactate transferase [Rhodococcus opacus]|uniref:2-phospho-L-lactate transferase n=2 Tax=Rhodococcus opacus TaxID=37919 RepID=A0A1B1K3W9_RHOOP|nr:MULTISPECIES: 2-phospho-L-lactate transferase [Rhodococcus]ELB90411.1 LPPG:FO 2-phospho-L-lactate transferase [Rhodococcus wratislaviensis IFP 2016]NHU48036.1 2-phospho-L-lactate transferase [Rhodococcus sp. A14]ANS27309.1 2-phospho-L-lactate transferase [Rhodococcus opacus]EKT76751.1 LPPG:FO 2-phospho-L-lactate transferase [Rhodococcus opacus M213]MCZ4585611.1 2-phospho-L-lactate transferase [Rhodococcus opacus]
MNVTVLVGGVGGARFLQGVRRLLGADAPGRAGADSGHSITAVVNVGDDVWMHGLRICPDLDTCMYTLGDGIDTERGWGHAGETWNAKAELAAYGAKPDWFGLGDRDIATHLIRTQMLRTGYPLSAVTEALCNRWQPGVTLLPVTDDRSETHVVITDPEDGEQRAIHFQEWWVRYRAQVPTHSFAHIGAEQAAPAPGVLEAIETADIVLLAPSNPVVSVGAILAVPGIRGALRTTAAKVVGISPIVGGKPLRGMADECLDVIGVDTSAEAIGRWYGARSGTGILDGWLVHDTDTAEVPGVEVARVPLIMSDPDATAAMVRAALDVAGVAL